MGKLYNLARMTTTTTGTGTLTLASAVTGFRTFDDAGVQNGDVVAYSIRNGANSEIGYGTYTTATKTLTRTVISSTNGNNAVSLSGTSQVTITPSARDWPGRPNVVWAGDYSRALTANDSSSTVKTANTAAIQDVIDIAYARGLDVINIGAGVFYCDPGIYLDPPGNLRSNFATPSIFSFSLHLRGAGGLYNNNNHGTQLRFTDNTTNALIVGTGQGMRVSDLSIIGPTGATSRAALSANGVGIGLAGGSGGLSRCLLDGVGVSNFRVGYKTGVNGNANLCDSVTLLKCVCFDCHTGIHVSQTQNYIVNLVACDFGGNKIHVKSDVAKAVNIFGGNYSTADAKKNAFTIGTVSLLTPFSDSLAGSSFTNATFTAVLTSPDQPMADGAYDAFVIDTVAFGPIPLVLTNYVSGTATGTFKFYPGWLLGSGLDAATLNGGALETLLESIIPSATLLYCCEQITTFQGYCINVDGVHVENPDGLTRFYHATSGFGGDPVSRFNRITFNHTLDHASLFSGTNAQKAVAFSQQVFPFIQGIDNADDLRCELTHIVNVATTNRIMIDWNNTVGGRFIVRDCDLRPNLRVPNRAVSFGPATNDFDLMTTGYGFGEWDDTPFFASADTTRYYARNKFAGVPYVGHFPAPYAVLTLAAADLAEVNGSLAAIGNYPAIMGRVPYRITYPTPPEAVSGVNAARWAESNHQYWSYGQNITVNWSYVGGSNILRLADLSRMFAGLRVTIDNGGGDENYVVTGVYPSLSGSGMPGYVSLVRWRVGTSASHLAGTYGTTYTAGTVKQEAFSFSYQGTLPESKTVTNATAGATTAAVGDMTGAGLVDLTLSAVGNANYTTRTATEMFGDIPGAYVGLTYHVAIKNTSTAITTVVAGSGVTLTGTATITAGSLRLFSVTFPSATTCTITSRFSHGDIGDAGDVLLRRDAANALGQRNGLNAQITRGYGTFSDASNYERWALQSGSGYFELAAETAGTGTDNIDLRLTPAGTGIVSSAFAIKSTSATGGVGYATGAGGTVTQTTSKSTGVTLNKVVGQITMDAAALAAATTVAFTLTNSAISADDVVHVIHRGTGTTGAYQIWATNMAAGSCSIQVRNITAGSLSEAIVLTFIVLKGVIA